MHKEGALKNIFKEDNWNEINKAPKYMYTVKNDKDKDHIVETRSVEHYNEEKEEPKPAAVASVSKEEIDRLKEEFFKAEKKYSELIESQNSTVHEMVLKMNELITNHNKLEGMLNVLDQKIERLSAIKPTEEKSGDKEGIEEEPVMEKKKAIDKPIDRTGIPPSQVSIEKMFNFSNKKFD